MVKHCSWRRPWPCKTAGQESEFKSNAASMRFFTKGRFVRRERAFDRKVRDFLNRSLNPSSALVISTIVCLSCGWCFLVVFAGWPRKLAIVPYFLGIHASPALAFVSLRELRRGWCGWLFFSAFLSLAGLAFCCLTTYLLIHSSVTEPD